MIKKSTIMYLPNEDSKIDVIVVLGAQVMDDKTPSPWLASRLDLVLDYSYLNVPIVVSGGMGSDEPIPESSSMKTYLVQKGIDPNLIYEEKRATSTYENLLYSKEIIQNMDQDIDKVLIITNNFHVFRTAFLAKRLDYDFYIAGVDSPKKLRNTLREPIAFMKSFIFDR